MATGNLNETVSPRNVLDIMQDELESRTLAEISFESIVAALIIAVAVFGNVLTLYVVFKNPALRTTPNMFVVSLALVDLLMGLTSIFMAEVVLITSGWAFDEYSCHFQAYMIIFSSTTALMTIALTAINRFFKVVKNSIYQKYFTKARTFQMIFCAWICGLVLPVPLLLRHTIVFIPSKLVCFVDVTTKWRIYVAAAMTVIVAFPLLVVAYCYLRIFLTVTKHQSNVFPSTQSRATNVQEIKITRMMFVIVLCFSICWMPAYITNMIDCARATFSLPRIAYLIHSFAAGFSCGVNPILYGAMNPTFRREYMKVLRCLKNNPTNSINPTDTNIQRTNK